MRTIFFQIFFSFFFFFFFFSKRARVLASTQICAEFRPQMYLTVVGIAIKLRKVQS